MPPWELMEAPVEYIHYAAAAANAEAHAEEQHVKRASKNTG